MNAPPPHWCVPGGGDSGTGDRAALPAAAACGAGPRHRHPARGSRRPHRGERRSAPRSRRRPRTAASATLASRASTRVARSHRTSTAHKNRNHRNRSIPYERSVDSALPAAWRSRKYADTASTGSPAESANRNGNHRSPVASSRPANGTGNTARSRGGSTSSITAGELAQPSHHSSLAWANPPVSSVNGSASGRPCTRSPRGSSAPGCGPCCAPRKCWSSTGRGSWRDTKRSRVRGGQVLVLDHYLEVLARKPGALPGSMALSQARAAGVFTVAHEAFWTKARAKHGDRDGTRALIEVLLLHRHLPAPTVTAGIQGRPGRRVDQPRTGHRRGPPRRRPTGHRPRRRREHRQSWSTSSVLRGCGTIGGFPATPPPAASLASIPPRRPA